jgi:hypothetical protein
MCISQFKDMRDISTTKIAKSIVIMNELCQESRAHLSHVKPITQHYFCLEGTALISTPDTPHSLLGLAELMLEFSVHVN